MPPPGQARRWAPRNENELALAAGQATRQCSRFSQSRAIDPLGSTLDWVEPRLPQAISDSPVDRSRLFTAAHLFKQLSVIPEDLRVGGFEPMARSVHVKAIEQAKDDQDSITKANERLEKDLARFEQNRRKCRENMLRKRFSNL